MREVEKATKLFLADTNIFTFSVILHFYLSPSFALFHSAALELNHTRTHTSTYMHVYDERPRGGKHEDDGAEYSQWMLHVYMHAYTHTNTHFSIMVGTFRDIFLPLNLTLTETCNISFAIYV